MITLHKFYCHVTWFSMVFIYYWEVKRLVISNLQLSMTFKKMFHNDNGVKRDKLV